MKQIIIALILCVMPVCANATWHTDTQAIMGTKVSVILWHEDDVIARQAIAAVMTEMRRIDAHFSPYIETSELYRLNQLAPKASAEQPLSISPELTRILDKALYYSRLSDGAFDVTFASLARYYDYRKKLAPSEQQREELLPLINYRFIHLDVNANTVWFEHPQVYVDLGGIAKGYSVDTSLAVLKKFGIEHANITAGGDSRVIGDRFGRPWLVGIKNPRAEAVAVTLPLENVSLSTSGDYERYFIDEHTGERVHHIINPRTGKSAHGVTSVTILGPAGFDTDPLSKVVFIKGPEQGLAIINRLPGFDAVIITDKGKVLYSKGLTPPQ